MTKKLKSIASSEVRRRYAWCLNHVLHTGTRIEIWRHGKPVAALVTHDDLEKLLKWERVSAQQMEYQRLADMEAYKAVAVEYVRRDYSEGER